MAENCAVFCVPQGWLAFGSSNGDPQATINILKGGKALSESTAIATPSTSPQAREQQFKVFTPTPYTRVKLPRPAFGYPKGTVVLTVPRPGKMQEPVILEMIDGRWETGWMILPGWQGQSALIAVDDGTNKFDPATARAIPLNQIKESYVVEGKTQEPLRQPEVRIEYEADLPDDYEDQEEEERP